MPIGNPISLTRNVASREVTASATQDQTLFTVTGGYRINQIDVYRNGVKLSDTNDYTALDGASVTLVQAANLNDELVFRIFDDFRVADAIVSAASTQVIEGDLTVNGDLFADNINLSELSLVSLDVSGITTFTNQTGSASTDSGAVQIRGGLGIGGSVHIGGNLSVGGTVTYEDVTNVDSIGVITARSKIVLGDFVEHRGDTDTKFGFPANNTFTVETDGSEKLRVTNQGRVGIGTDDPDEMLEIFGADPKIRLTDSTQDNDNRRSEISSNEGDTVYNAIKAGAAGTHIFQGNGTEILRITANGNVGIGTIRPDLPVNTAVTSRIAVGVVTANFLHGDGAGLTNVPGRVGIESGGVLIGVSTTLNFVGTGNTVIVQGDGTIDINISSGGAVGAGTDKVFIENTRTVTEDYELSTGFSAVSVGPIIVSAGVTVTVPANERWVVL